jgi:hypothetical protein
VAFSCQLVDTSIIYYSDLIVIDRSRTQKAAVHDCIALHPDVWSQVETKENLKTLGNPLGKKPLVIVLQPFAKALGRHRGG